MDFKAELNKQVVEEEDGFYAEIRKRIILLLTAYDDDEMERGVAGRQSDHQPHLERNLSRRQNGDDFEGRVCHENGNGTGVFIPQAVKYTRYCIFGMYLS